MTGLFRRFLRCEAGNFSQMMIVMALPLVGAMGLAIDYSQASRIRTQLLGAADAAAVGSVAVRSPAYEASAKMGKDGPIKAGEEDAINLFNGYMVGKQGLKIIELKADVRKDGSLISSKVSFTVDVPMMFMGLFGRDRLTVRGSSSAETRDAPYMDFYLLLDNSPSMGVGATPSDVAKMVANTPDKCAFACHDLSDSDSYYNLAKTIGVTMRIDVVRQATQALMDTATAKRNHSNQFRMAVYTFGDRAENTKLTRIAKLTSNLEKVQKSAAKIDLMTIPYQNYDSDQLTGFDNAFEVLNSEIDEPGNGESTGQRQKTVFFVSDGVGDSFKPVGCTQKLTGGRCQEPIDIKACQQIKDRGITVAVLYTTYLPLPTNDWYNTWIKPFQDDIGVKMQACATPGYFFEVSPTQGISEALQALFLKVVANPHITS
jgi:hypothetical protein